MKFKVGDRVRLTEPTAHEFPDAVAMKPVEMTEGEGL